MSEGTSDEAQRVSSPKHFNARTNPQSLPAAWARGASPAWRLPWLPWPSVPKRAEPTHAPSVGEGREDEEAVFFFADPAHQLMDGTDGRRLGPQGAVAHVELKGTCHLEEGAQGSHRG